MSGWRILKARRIESGVGPTVEQTKSYLEAHTELPFHVYGGEDVIVAEIRRRESEPLREFAKDHSEVFDLVSIASGNDTGPGSGQATFYEPDNGTLEKITSGRAPLSHDGLMATGEI